MYSAIVVVLVTALAHEVLSLARFLYQLSLMRRLQQLPSATRLRTHVSNVGYGSLSPASGGGDGRSDPLLYKGSKSSADLDNLEDLTWRDLKWSEKAEVCTPVSQPTPHRRSPRYADRSGCNSYGIVCSVLPCC